jgi:hypothetical protein
MSTRERFVTLSQVSLGASFKGSRVRGWRRFSLTPDSVWSRAGREFTRISVHTEDRCTHIAILTKRAFMLRFRLWVRSLFSKKSVQEPDGSRTQTPVSLPVVEIPDRDTAA